MNKWTDAEIDRLRDLHKQGFSYQQIADKLGRTWKSVERKWFTIKSDAPSGPISIESRVTSVADLLKFFDVDESVWAVKNARVNTWEQNSAQDGIVPMYQARADLVPLIPPRDMDVMAELKDDLLDAGSKVTWSAPPVVDGEYMLELDLFDHHFGSYVWGAETMGDDWDQSRAEERFHDAFGRLLNLSSLFPIERVLIPMGNDLVHYEPGAQDSGAGHRTLNGTLLDSDTRYKHTYKRVREAFASAIETAAAMFPVDVVVVPGNHAGITEFTIGDSLECWFRNHPNVSIDNSPPVRKYYSYGQNVIGFTHGHGEKLTDLPLIMAQESPYWSCSKFREWHIGHRHRTRHTVHQPVEDIKGVVVRELPSLTPTDAWHFFKGFIGSQRGATAFLWSRDHGPEGQFSFNALG